MPLEKRIVLDPRLSLIAELVGKCECYADIGCDHGRLGAFLLQTGCCRRAQLTDISSPSLDKAKRLISLLGFKDRVDFCVGDGALALSSPADVVVIAGMGGTTIGEIICKGREKLNDARLVLQPNVAALELRRTLSDAGYCITDEHIAPDGRRNYVIIVAEPGESCYDEKQQIVGPVLLEKMPDTLKPYAEFRLNVALKALKGAVSGEDEDQKALLEREIEIWKDVCACLQR